MKEELFRTRNSITKVVRDDHDESGKYYFHQTIFDDHILERNKRIRLEGLTPRGRMMPFLGQGDPAPVAFAFSIPAEHFARIKRDMPDLWAGLVNKDPEENKKAAQRLQLLHPEWSVMEANR
jgi:hypothetical protein